MDRHRESLILLPQEISNHPELIRRLGCLAMTGVIDTDVYVNFNSNHVNGIGGSGDFARNACISFFMTPSTAKKGATSCIVPMVTHVDHTGHDVHVLFTEQGLADLRGLSPKQRAERVIQKCARPGFRPTLRDYARRAGAASPGKNTPHLLDEAFAWQRNFLRTGSMRTG